MNGGFSPLTGFMGRKDYESVCDHDAPGGRDALADADHAGRARGLRRRRCTPAVARAARSGRRDAGGPARRGRVGAGSRTPRRRRCSARPTRSIRASRPARSQPSVSRGRPRRRACSCRRTTTTTTCGMTPAQVRDAVREARLDARRRVPDAQPDAPRAPGADAARRDGRRREAAHPPGRRHDEAGRRRPLHARALLPGAARRATPPTRRRSRCCRWRCAWAGRARRCGTRSSARTTAARTSSSAATTPAPARTPSGKPFYGPYDAQELLRKHAGRARRDDGAVPQHGVRRRTTTSTSRRTRCRRARRCSNLSGTELRRLLQTGAEIPSWFTFPEVVEELRAHASAACRARASRCSSPGLSGSGKSTIANALLVKLLEMGGRPVTLLDGDLVRKHLSSELGFSKEHRDINIRRIGYVASEITKNGGIAICAPIAPYDSIRKEVRADDRAARRLRADPRRDLARGVRAARPQGPLRQGARRHPASSSPAFRIRTRNRRTRRSCCRPRARRPRKPPTRCSSSSSRKGTWPTDMASVPGSPRRRGPPELHEDRADRARVEAGPGDASPRRLVHTGQHYDAAMSEVFFERARHPAPRRRPRRRLGLARAADGGRSWRRSRPVVLDQRPDLLVVVGDVNSTIACALVAAKLHVRVAHVEAGLRSFDRAMPEEINRILTDPHLRPALRHRGVRRRRTCAGKGSPGRSHSLRRQRDDRHAAVARRRGAAAARSPARFGLEPRAATASSRCTVPATWTTTATFGRADRACSRNDRARPAASSSPCTRARARCSQRSPLAARSIDRRRSPARCSIRSATSTSSAWSPTAPSC